MRGYFSSAFFLKIRSISITFPFVPNNTGKKPTYSIPFFPTYSSITSRCSLISVLISLLFAYFNRTYSIFSFLYCFHLHLFISCRHLSIRYKPWSLFRIFYGTCFTYHIYFYYARIRHCCLDLISNITRQF